MSTIYLKSNSWYKAYKRLLHHQQFDLYFLRYYKYYKTVIKKTKKASRKSECHLLLYDSYLKLLTQKCAKTLISNIFFISSAEDIVNGWQGIIPALLTKTETSPTSFTTFEASSTTSSLFDTSHLKIRTWCNNLISNKYKKIHARSCNKNIVTCYFKRNWDQKIPLYLFFV